MFHSITTGASNDIEQATKLARAMVTRCKPDPEIYLLAAEGLHLPSAECLVFEDARVGITAARRAGAGRIVALATTLPRHTLATQTEADVVIDDFASITDLNTLLL